MARYPVADAANKFSKAVIAGKVPACRYVRQACQRHLDDLLASKSKTYPYEFDAKEAQKKIALIELLPHTKGEWGFKRQLITFEPWQKFGLACTFGWKRKKDGLRRFRESYWEVNRKNGKSVIAAGVGLAMFAADNEFGAEIYSGATTEKQAWEVFRPARLMAMRSPMLLEAVGIEVNASNLNKPGDGSRFEPIIGNPGDGASPSCSIVDEYHEHDSDSLYTTMLTGMGAFEQLHGLADGAAFSSHLAREAQLCHGAVGHAFLQWATEHADTLVKRVRQQSGALAASWTPGKASGQVARVAARFALVGVAGELATEAGLTGWEPGESERATKACFEAWLLARGGAGNGEVTAMLRQVRGFLEAHGEGRFTWWHRATDDHNTKTLQRAGFRRLIDEDGKPLKILKTGYTPGTPKEDKDIYEAMTAIDGEETRVEYFVLPEVFRTEIFRGFDYKAVCKVLLQHGCLKPAKGREYDAKHRLPGVGHAWCYQFTPAIMELEI